MDARHEKLATQSLVSRELQRKYPGATLVKDSGSRDGGQSSWAIDRKKFPFAGQWLFDYGVLTLHQDSSGKVAGVFATKVFYYTAQYDIDGTKPTTGSAILAGQAKGSKLQFTLFDYRGRERTGTLVLDGDGTSGKWTLEATDPLLATGAAKTAPGVSTAPAPKQSAKKGPRQPGAPAPGNSPFGVPPGGAARATGAQAVQRRGSRPQRKSGSNRSRGAGPVVDAIRAGGFAGWLLGPQR